ncbi:hypothetical protein HDR63_00755 [bacterium]|nr:hypothetical protein [bacterium]
MFGISWAEFLVILVVAIVIIPAKHWPDVARILGRAVRFVRQIIWKLSDMSEQICQQIDLQQPIDDLIRTTTDDVLDAFSTRRPPKKSVKKAGRRK